MAKYSRAGRRMPDPELQSVRAKRNSSINGLLMFFVVVVAAIFVMSVLLRVSDIRVEGNEHYTDEEIINAIDIEEGDNLFFFDRFAAISRVFAKLPYVEQVSVERSLPNKVVITVVECKALAYIELGEEAWTIDRNCKILGKATDEEKAERSAAIQLGLVECIKTPMEMMELSLRTVQLTESLLGRFNTSSASDLGVGALSLRAAVQGAWLNVLINIGSLKDRELADSYRTQGEKLVQQVLALSDHVYETVLTLV